MKYLKNFDMKYMSFFEYVFFLGFILLEEKSSQTESFLNQTEIKFQY